MCIWNLYLHMHSKELIVYECTYMSWNHYNKSLGASKIAIENQISITKNFWVHLEFRRSEKIIAFCMIYINRRICAISIYKMHENCVN